MMKRLVLLLLLISGPALAQSPYAGQQARDIKSLSKSDVEGYLGGKGMGFAKAAELNGYPGPKHVLEFADELGLTERQRMETQALFDDMQKKASSLGAELVAEERRLDELFANGSVDRQTLEAVVTSIGSLRAAIRFEHLAAHLRQTDILSKEQVRKYSQLRGYHGHSHADHKPLSST